MVKEKKYVKVKSNESDSKEVYGKDDHWKIIKIEQTGDPKKRATTKRVFAIIFWLIAIVFEVIWILKLTHVIDWFSGLELKYFVIICIVLDLLFFIPGSLLWKKANHIDPISEKNKTKFWIRNNLGTILSVLAFLPIIVVVLASKDLDKKSKGIVTAVAVIALAIAGLSSYDYNPVSSEQLERAEKEVLQVSPSWTVYWAKYSKKYHVDKDCPAFSNSETVFEGSVRDAYEKWLTDPCRRCIPEYHEDDTDTENNGDVKDNEENENVLWDIIWWLLE